MAQALNPKVYVPLSIVNHNKHLNPCAAIGAQVALIDDRVEIGRCTRFRDLMTSRPVDGRRNPFSHMQFVYAGLADLIR